MINSRMIDTSPTVARSPFAARRAWSGSRLGLLSIAGVAIVAGLGLNWSWLVAAGVAPLLLSVLPCVVMCALGLCMMHMTKKSEPMSYANDPVSAASSTRLPGSDARGLPEAPISSDAALKAE